jgi:hypothetical protein
MTQARLFGDFHGKDQSRRRFWIGMWISMGLHACVLSLQFGVPGLGLPSLERPREERRTQSMDLQVALNQPGPGAVRPEGSAPLANTASALPSPSQASPLPPSPSSAALPAPAAEQAAPTTPSAAPGKLRMVNPRTVETVPVPPSVSTPSKAPAPAKPRRIKPAPKRRQPPPVIAKAPADDSRFVVPVPSPEEPADKEEHAGPVGPSSSGNAIPAPQAAVKEPEPDNRHAEEEAQRVAGETQRLADEAAAKRAAESAERAEAAEAEAVARAAALQREQDRHEAEARQANAREAAEQEAARQLEEERRQAEAQQLAAAREQRALQAQQELEQQRRQEAQLQAAQRQVAQEQEARRRQEQEAETARRQALVEQDAQRRAQEEAARLADMQRQEEQRRMEVQRQEDLRLAKQQADALRARAEEELRRRQAEELAARQRAEESAARQRAEAEAQAAAAARQREQDRLAALSRDDSSAGAGGQNSRRNDMPGAVTGALPRNLPGAGDLASRALEQVRRPELPRMDAQAPRPLPEGAEASRRRSVLGKAPQDVGLAMYVEGWRLKIERTGRLNYTQSAVDRSLVDAIVTVLVRSDGSVEEILFNRSSGRQELDDAIRRIIRINAKYASFPPDLARRSDVIEIRRIWNFEDNKLKLIEEIQF